MKKMIRKILFIKESEKITDGLDRHITKVKKKVTHSNNQISEELFFKKLKDMGINKGDTIMVHSSWRKFYNYNGTPESFIKSLMDLVGTEGTILMPSFGEDLNFFDINNSPSKAGILSETFRKLPNVVRSECSHFSISAWGKEARALTEQHKNSIFGFDTNSPYYLITQRPDVKILKLGMGKYPVKTTLIHCVEYIYKDKIPFFDKYISEEYEANVVDQNGEMKKRNMIKGKPARLNKLNITKFYKALPNEFTQYKRIGNIDVRILVADKSFSILKEFSKNDIFMVKLL